MVDYQTGLELALHASKAGSIPASTTTLQDIVIGLGCAQFNDL